METMKRLISLHGHIAVFMLLISISKGSSCVAPSSPECYRRGLNHSIYHCEWNKTESHLNFDFYDGERYHTTSQPSIELCEEQLTTHEPVNIWVEAYTFNSSCTSTISSVVLADIVKYETPYNVSMSWVKNKLRLKWTAAETSAALAEVRFRKHEAQTESWEKRSNTTKIQDKWSLYHLSLLKNLSYEVQIRQRSILSLMPLWSGWSDVVKVPAELTDIPVVKMTTRLLNGSREVVLTWEPMPRAAAVTKWIVKLEESQSLRECPCTKRRHHNETNKYILYLSYSAANISVVAKNAAGFSPSVIKRLPAQPAEDLKECEKSLLDKKLKSKTFLEWYEHQDEDLKPETVITSAENLKDFVRYVYYEHRCVEGKPRTVKMCLFYKNEDAPLTAPHDLSAFSETQTSTNLSWKAIPIAEQQGFLTHYSLCIGKISSQGEQGECQNISASLTAHLLENLAPATKYLIALAGVTRGGVGPNITVSISTLPEKSVNVWWSLGLLIVFFLFSTTCTFILKSIKTKIFPPVPTPAVDFNPYPTEDQVIQERKEEVHEVTFHKLLPERKLIQEEAEETTVLRVRWDDGSDQDEETERGDSRMSGEISDEAKNSTEEALQSSKEGESTDLEFAMLIYRNGLVFDMKTDSP